MKTKNQTLASLIVKNGFILAVLQVALYFLVYVLDINMFSPGFGIINFLISVSIMVYILVRSMKFQRDQLQYGEITYGQKFINGFFIILIGGIVSGLVTFVFNQYFDPDFMMGQMDRFIENMENRGVQGEMLDNMLDRMEANMEPGAQLRNLLLYTPVMAAVVALIVAGVVKKSNESTSGIQ